MDSYLQLLRRILRRTTRKNALLKLKGDLLYNKSYQWRLMYVKVCRRALVHYSKRFFKENFLETVLSIDYDSVSSVSAAIRRAKNFVFFSPSGSNSNGSAANRNQIDSSFSCRSTGDSQIGEHDGMFSRRSNDHAARFSEQRTSAIGSNSFLSADVSLFQFVDEQRSRRSTKRKRRNVSR